MIDCTAPVSISCIVSRTMTRFPTGLDFELPGTAFWAAGEQWCGLVILQVYSMNDELVGAAADITLLDPGRRL